MPTRFEDYRVRDGVTVLGQDFFNPVLADIDTRIAALEERRADWNQVLTELTTFGLQRIDVLVGPAMAEANAMLAELRTKRDQLVAAIGNIGNLVTGPELVAVLADFQDQLTKESVGLGNVDNVNAADLRDRQTHTGEQGIATITGLDEALAARTITLVEAGTITANTNAQAGKAYNIDTSGGAFAITLPATPAVGTRVGVRDVALACKTNNLTLVRNGQRIEGADEDLTVDLPLRGVFVFIGGARGWILN